MPCESQASAALLLQLQLSTFFLAAEVKNGTETRAACWFEHQGKVWIADEKGAGGWIDSSEFK